MTRNPKLQECPKCGHPFDLEHLGKYGCPNCHGDGLIGFGPVRPCRVFVEGEEIPSDEVKFLNIEEDVFGRDCMTFEFKGKTYKSLIIG